MDADLALARGRRLRRRSRRRLCLGRRSGHVVDGDAAARAGTGESVEGDAELDRGPARDRRRDGTPRRRAVGSRPRLGGRDRSGRRSHHARAAEAPAVRRDLPHRRRSQASRSALPRRRSRPPGRGSSRASRPTRPRRHGGLVGLDLDQAVAAREGLARRLQPPEDDRVGHRVGELRHRQLAWRHGVSP